MLIARIIVVVAIGALLVAANVWYYSLLKSFLSTVPTPRAIGPFQVMGGDGESSEGRAMAFLLRARLGRIRQEMQASASYLRESPPPALPAEIRAGYQAVRPVFIPNRVFEEIQIDLRVAGVELGGILAWLQRLLYEDRVLRIVVEYQGERAVAVANLDLFGGRPLHVSTAKDTEAIITGIAYELVQRQMSVRVPEVGALEVEEFEQLLTTLQRVVDLNRRVALGRAVGTDYDEPLSKLSHLAEKTPRWRDLIHLTAEVAENAGRDQEVLRFYEMELALVDPGVPDYKEIARHVERLSAELSGATALAPVAAEADPATILEQLRRAPSVGPILSLLAADEVGDGATGVSIAVLGGAPSEGLLAANQMEILAPVTSRPPGEAAYIDSLVRAVQLVAPRAAFWFMPRRGDGESYTTQEVLVAWDGLTAKGPDILLVTLAPLTGRVFDRLFQEAERRGTVVVAVAAQGALASQQAQRAPAPPLQRSGLTVAAVGLNGLPLEQGPHAPGVVWAPGEKIPALLADRTTLELWSGNWYAAALAAGVAARVKAAAPEIGAAELALVLKSTARPRPDSGGPRVLDLEAALHHVSRRGPAAAGAAFERENTVDQRIPDNSPAGLQSSIDVPVSGQLGAVEVAVEIEHTFAGDLVVVLTTPSGQGVTLHDRAGGSSDGVRLLQSSRTHAGLAALLGEPIQGTWRLSVSDHAALDVGTLRRWSLKLSSR